MNEVARSRFRTFYLLFIPLLLPLALILNRWWAWLSLIGFLIWIVKKWLSDPKSEIPRQPA